MSKVFFYDDRDLAGKSNLELVPGPVEKLGVVMGQDRPSDLQRASCFAGSVVPLDDGRYRLYYSASHWDPPRVFRLAVAESADGLHWEKPDLGQVDWQGAPTNHLWPAGMPEGARCTQPQVVRLPDGSWRMWFWWHGHETGHIRYVPCESVDGLQWRVIDLERPAIFHPSDREVGQNGWVAGLTAASPQDKFADQRTWDWMEAKRLRSNDATYVYYDDISGKLVMYSVWLLPNYPESGHYVPHDNAPQVRRIIHRRESDDGLAWSDPELLLVPDEYDPPHLQFYYLAVERDPDWHLGFLGHYRCWEQTMDIELCFSRDGHNWLRPLRGGWVPRGGVDEIDYFSAYAANRLLDRGDRLLLLYNGGNFKHNWELPESVTERKRANFAAAIRPGRFAGLRATERMVGSLLLKPFAQSAEQITVDADIQGELRAELRDPYGRPFEGYEFATSIPARGDSSEHVLTWSSGKTTAPYRYDVVTLKLELTDGTLYSICT